MIKSMTGFGKAASEIQGFKISVEVKSLNSKQLELSVKLPLNYREKEIELRNEIGRQLQRGKVDALVTIESNECDPTLGINEAAFRTYYQQMKQLANELQPDTDVFSLVMRIPAVFKSERELIDETLWNELLICLNKSLAAADAFRAQEGKALMIDFEQRIAYISSLLEQIAPFEQKRLDTVKAKLKQSLAEVIENNTLDANRFEQELIYYLEKLDITEEKVRLGNHLAYFIEVMNTEENPGKKLGFVAQEIGREINTIGSKANQSDMQRIVVQMKDELEKIKEQLMNIL
jgi:uncharacterized protein (TIGR00255 family)